jgi:hypothetical protein
MPFHCAALAIPHLDLFLRGHDHVKNLVLHAHCLDALLKVVAHLVLIAGITVDHIPGRPLGDGFEVLLRDGGFLVNSLRLV